MLCPRPYRGRWKNFWIVRIPRTRFSSRNGPVTEQKSLCTETVEKFVGPEYLACILHSDASCRGFAPQWPTAAPYATTTESGRKQRNNCRRSSPRREFHS